MFNVRSRGVLLAVFWNVAPSLPRRNMLCITPSWRSQIVPCSPSARHSASNPSGAPPVTGFMAHRQIPHCLKYSSPPSAAMS